MTGWPTHNETLVFSSSKRTGLSLKRGESHLNRPLDACSVIAHPMNGYFGQGRRWSFLADPNPSLPVDLIFQ
ncbi:MAG: hypothetical protein EBS79_04510 [Gammaproteobacteria bacterium]|nr:hypothetical protein [Gammaproteobacteria bacterium]NDE55304.1 hypothetical protein [Gammaproteobacteria bacterium]NDG86701.1 hypothetical protein [Gammaproteobacteria bacterium]